LTQGPSEVNEIPALGSGIGLKRKQRASLG